MRGNWGGELEIVAQRLEICHLQIARAKTRASGSHTAFAAEASKPTSTAKRQGDPQRRLQPHGFYRMGRCGGKGSESAPFAYCRYGKGAKCYSRDITNSAAAHQRTARAASAGFSGIAGNSQSVHLPSGIRSAHRGCPDSFTKRRREVARIRTS